MVSPELIRRYPFFAGLSHEHLATLAGLAEDITVGTGHVFFREDDTIDHFYLVVEGAIAVFMEIPDRTKDQPLSGQLTGELPVHDVIVSTVGSGEVFGWAALVPPPVASGGAKAVTPCRVIAFDAARLQELFDTDCTFGYQMTQKAATVMRERLRDMRIESITLHHEH
jgi:CRP-like cAMP-binding protein